MEANKLASPQSGRAFLPVPTIAAVSPFSSELNAFFTSLTPQEMMNMYFTTPATSPLRQSPPFASVGSHASSHRQLFDFPTLSPTHFLFDMPADIQPITPTTSTSTAVSQRKSPKRNARCVSCLSAMKSAPYNWFSWNVSVYNAQSVRQHIGQASTDRLHQHKMKEIEYYCEVQPVYHCFCLLFVLIHSISNESYSLDRRQETQTLQKLLRQQALQLLRRGNGPQQSRTTQPPLGFCKVAVHTASTQDY